MIKKVRLLPAFRMLCMDQIPIVKLMVLVVTLTM